MDIDAPLPLLGGLSPAAFMRRHWQRRPLLVRQAWPGVQPPATRAELFALAARSGVESRVVSRVVSRVAGQGWQLRRGPFRRGQLPGVREPGWTLLVQGLDLHLEAAHEMLRPFRFVNAARLDDLMVSWASPGGGVGPHTDAYDVFLLQVQGRRRWRVGPVANPALVPGLPVKILRHFVPQQEWLLEPGDMLYLPPNWGHDGVAEGPGCMTCSVGFRAPSQAELARELLGRLADAGDDEPAAPQLYRDPPAAATAAPAQLPEALSTFARRALAQALAQPHALARALGEWATEPKPQVWFDAGAVARGPLRSLRLDRRSRMMYDRHHVYLNGESYRAAGLDAELMHELADQRRLPAARRRRLGAPARALVRQWCEAGWMHDE